MTAWLPREMIIYICDFCDIATTCQLSRVCRHISWAVDSSDASYLWRYVKRQYAPHFLHRLLRLYPDIRSERQVHAYAQREYAWEYLPWFSCVINRLIQNKRRKLKCYMIGPAHSGKSSFLIRYADGTSIARNCNAF